METFGIVKKISKVLIDFDDPNALQDIFAEEYRLDHKFKNQWKKALKGLINTTGLWRYLNEGQDGWSPIGVVEIRETDERESGYRNYPHARVVDEKPSLLYLRMDDPFDDYKPRNISHYYVWQTCGYLGDDYSGYLLFPLNDGRYFKVSYSC